MARIYQEITDQYNAMRKTASYLDGKAEELCGLLKRTEPGRILFIGCGSSYSLSTSMATITARYLGRHTASVAAGDLMLHPDCYAGQAQGALIVAVTRSGSTTEIYKALEALRNAGVSFSLLTLTCVENAGLSAESDAAVVLPWAFDECVCQTRTVSCLYFAWCYLTALAAGDETLKSSLMAVARQGEDYLKRWEPVLKGLAGKAWNHACVMADAEISGIAEEGALAFKEICQLPSNFYHMLDSRHGPFVLFGSSTLAIVAVSSACCKVERDYLSDLVQKGSEVIVYSNQPIEIDGVTNISFGQELAHTASGLPLIALIQLLTYFKSEAIGVDAENPTGLTAWIAL